jgi:hypothetical protein
MIPMAFFDVASKSGEIYFITKCGSIGVLVGIIFPRLALWARARFVINTISTIYSDVDVAIDPI